MLNKVSEENIILSDIISTKKKILTDKISKICSSERIFTNIIQYGIVLYFLFKNFHFRWEKTDFEAIASCGIFYYCYFSDRRRGKYRFYVTIP